MDGLDGRIPREMRLESTVRSDKPFVQSADLELDGVDALVDVALHLCEQFRDAFAFAIVTASDVNGNRIAIAA